MSTTEEVSNKRSSVFKGGMTKYDSTRENNCRQIWHENGIKIDDSGYSKYRKLVETTSLSHNKRTQL